MDRWAGPEAGSGSHDTGGRGLLLALLPCATAHNSGPGSVLVIVSVVVIVAVIIVLVVIVSRRHDIGDSVKLVLEFLILFLEVRYFGFQVCFRFGGSRHGCFSPYAWIEKLHLAPVRVVLKAFGLDFIGPVWIAQNIAGEPDSLFLAAFQLGAGEGLHHSGVSQGRA